MRIGWQNSLSARIARTDFKWRMRRAARKQSSARSPQPKVFSQSHESVALPGESTGEAAVSQKPQGAASPSAPSLLQAA